MIWSDILLANLRQVMQWAELILFIVSFKVSSLVKDTDSNGFFLNNRVRAFHAKCICEIFFRYYIYLLFVLCKQLFSANVITREHPCFKQMQQFN